MASSGNLSPTWVANSIEGLVAVLYFSVSAESPDRGLCGLEAVNPIDKQGGLVHDWKYCSPKPESPLRETMPRSEYFPSPHSLPTGDSSLLSSN